MGQELVSRSVFTIRNTDTDVRGVLTPALTLRAAETGRFTWLTIKADDKGTNIFQLVAKKSQFYVVKSTLTEVYRYVTIGDELLVETSVQKVGERSFALATNTFHVKRSSHTTESFVPRDEIILLLIPSKVLVGQSGRSENMDIELKGFLNRQIVYNPDLQDFPIDEMKSLETYVQKYKIRMSDIDTLNHVNNAKYMDYMDDTRLRASTSGFIRVDQSRTDDISYASLKRSNVDYMDQCRVGEEIEVSLRYRRIDGNDDALDTYFEIRRADVTGDKKRILCRARVEWNLKRPQTAWSNPKPKL
ncbi:acyl-ACP thioesterase [Planoprotostelium fungivorum]|uniref:Acyl-ACP thioesterase n=1 Tax=Planoprotostelium fungivorum TaxID=1890364 RepID=A0A2P6NVG4_9EUKA|nr:acyl-ACP thioesterase [Planoprotostelium fungivorum]